MAVEWVETTGRTVEAAVDAALDELGVDEQDLEFEVVQEPRSGLLSRREARIRARVKPLSREKPGNRRGGRTRGGRPGGEGNGARGERRSGESKQNGAGQRSRKRSRGSRSGAKEQAPKQEVAVEEADLTVEEQARIAEDFVVGLVEAFGAEADVASQIDEDSVLVDVTGEGDLGLLVGPKGVTLQAVEELARTAVHRRTEGRAARINVDVAGYRARRREALGGFALELAEKVRESGRDQALEPMSAADRKVVHDAISTLDGVTTISEGEEPRRRVVVRRA